jgi:uncharacterized protein YjbI with pentapeptide repeats
LFSLTRTALEQFDNQHDFERMAADILNALGYKDVVPIAPRGGGDGGRDITFTAKHGVKGLACVTLRQDIDKKFKQDFSQRSASEFKNYALFCTAYLSAKQKSDFITYCANILRAELILYDIEALRSLLDTPFPDIKGRLLHINSNSISERERTTILQVYLDRISELLRKDSLRESKPNDVVRAIARRQTLTVLSQLDADRKGHILRFLCETGLIPIIDLEGANLSGVNLRKADLRYAHMEKVNLSDADLFAANLSEANLTNANLRNATLCEANLSNAMLIVADLTNANLANANLSDAHLGHASLDGASLSGVRLYGPDLFGVDLSKARLDFSRMNMMDLHVVRMHGIEIEGYDEFLEHIAKINRNNSFPP